MHEHEPATAQAGPASTPGGPTDVGGARPGPAAPLRLALLLSLVAAALVVVPGVGQAADRFADVDEGHPFHTEISWLAAQGITTGFEDGTFRPGRVVTRQAAAAFLHRLAGAPAGPFDTEGFADVDEGHPFHTEISWLAAQGITTGFEDGTFRPGRVVTRQAAAAFLHRFLSEPDADGGSGFDDVDEQHPFHDAITWLADRQVTTGFQDGTFRPGRPVTRQAAAAFHHRLDDTVAQASVSGTVVDADDSAPIADAVVAVAGLGAQAVTDADGAYTIEDVWPGDRTVAGEAEGYGPTTRAVTVPEGGEVGQADLVLKALPTGAISGVVTRSFQSGAVEGATVRVEGTSREATTGEDGSYTIDRVPADVHDVTAEAEGRRPKTVQDVEVVEGETTEDVNFSLRRMDPGSISGTVTDADGSPLVGATVRVEGTNLQVETSDGEGEETEAGEYTIFGAPVGTHTVTANRIEYEPQSQQVTVGEDEDVTGVDFELEISPPQVEFYADGAPLEGEVERLQGWTAARLSVVNPPDEEQDLELHWWITNPGGQGESGLGACEDLFTGDSCATINGDRDTANSGGGFNGTTHVVDEEDDEPVLQVADYATLGDWTVRWDVTDADQGHTVFSTSYEIEVLQGPLGGEMIFAVDDGEDGDGIDGNEFPRGIMIEALNLRVEQLRNPGVEELELRLHLQTPSGSSFQPAKPGEDGGACEELFAAATCDEVLPAALARAAERLSDEGEYEDGVADEIVDLLDEDAVDLRIDKEAEEGDWTLRLDIGAADPADDRAFSRDYAFTVAGGPIDLPARGNVAFQDDEGQSMEREYLVGEESHTVDLRIEELENPEDHTLRMRMVVNDQNGKWHLGEDACDQLFTSDSCDTIFAAVGIGEHDAQHFTTGDDEGEVVFLDGATLEFNAIGTQHAAGDEWTIRWYVEDADTGARHFSQDFNITFVGSLPA